MAFSIPDSTIEEIKSRIDLGDLIASYGIALRHVGSRLMACCPFHGEKTPSFSIEPAKGLYHCFGCGESGDAIKFVMKQEALPFGEAVRKLASQCGVEIQEQQEDPGAGRRKRLYALMAELAQFYHRCLTLMKSAQIARDYLARRDLDEKTRDDFLIGYAPPGAEPILTWAKKYGYTADDLVAAGVLKPSNREGGEPFHRFGGRLMFTVRDRQGRVVAFSGRQLIEDKRSGKYVNSPETEIFKKSNVLFGLDRAAGAIAKAAHREAIICEGQIDCIRLHISGFPVAVAGQGTAFTDEHVRMLARVADAALLVYDDDAAGHKATIRSAALLLAAGVAVRVVRLPGGDDPDSFLRTKGADAFRRLCDDAESIVHFQIAVERGKEQNPDSVNAVSRISKAVLTTIAQCPNAVLKAGMVGEAAKLLSIPAIALNEELAKVRVSAKPKTAEPAPIDMPPPDDEGIGDDPRADADAEAEAEMGERAAAILPPPQCEGAFMAFLMANEGDAQLAAIAAEFLPQDVFAHEFTRKFVAEWRERASAGEEISPDFLDALADAERKWFDAAMLDSAKSMSSGLAKEDVMRDFARALWLRHLERMRGALNAAPTDFAEIEWSCRLTRCIHDLRTGDWQKASAIIKDFIQSKKPET